MERAVGEIAAGAGYLLRAVLWLLDTLRDAFGPLLVFWGVWQLSHPWAYIFAGGFMMAVTLWRGQAPRRGRRR